MEAEEEQTPERPRATTLPQPEYEPRDRRPRTSSSQAPAEVNPHRRFRIMGKPASAVPVPEEEDDELESETLHAEVAHETELPHGWKQVPGELILDDILRSTTERTMTSDERAAFCEAKRLEVQEFFGNDVWSSRSGSRVAAERVLKARWILKWPKHPDGSPPAKARLVLHGFNDPDALAGTVMTSSPTTPRTGRNLMFIAASCSGWKVAVADVATAFFSVKTTTPVVRASSCRCGAHVWRGRRHANVAEQTDVRPSGRTARMVQGGRQAVRECWVPSTRSGPTRVSHLRLGRAPGRLRLPLRR